MSVGARSRPSRGNLDLDDGWLAATTLGVVAFTGAVRFMLPTHPMLAGTILLIGCLGVLVRSVLAGLPN
jgi:hypothetical protein